MWEKNELYEEKVIFTMNIKKIIKNYFKTSVWLEVKFNIH